MTQTLFRQLERINQRPKIFCRYTAADLWTDPHTSKQMLAFHLNSEVDLSSRKLEFIERSVEWLAARFGIGSGTAIADFGCGPGLYAQRLANRGACVTGIDFSVHSLNYAREQAHKYGTEIEYVETDYLEFSSTKRFDLILLIMCDFCALSPEQRQRLLWVFRTHLQPGGAVVLDAHSLQSFEQREQVASYAFNQLDGFWSAKAYYGFVNTFKYEAEKVVLDKYTLVTEDETREVYNWLQYFDRNSLSQELERAGFTTEEILADVAGAQYRDDAPELAVVARVG
ncbi:MAG: methyltransferase domain-containing protein [Proteobacteria bacterium]|nr:methyltransferase domain-containing protein [Pseudomonadota bacterium]